MDDRLDPALAAWLLDPANPTVRRLAIARLELEDGAGTDVGAPPIADEPWVRALLTEPPRPGGDPAPLHAYQKWAGPHWRLAALAELDVPAADPAVAPVIAEAFERVVAWLEAPGRLEAATPLDGRARVHGSQEGLAAWAAIRHGLAGEPGVARAIERLVEWQWPDGGWNCDRHRGASHSSFNESFAAIRALGAYARAVGRRTALGRDAGAAAGRGTEFLLVHEVVHSHRTGRLAHPALDGQSWPPYWHYDRLIGLRVLMAAGRLADPRTARAVGDLRASASADGRWRSTTKRWRAPGTAATGVEAVDWTADGSAKVLTLQAIEVLRAAGAA
jgi:hypothetical protein